MNFVNYSTALFPNLTYNQQVILESTTNTIYVDSITICNTSSNDIRINLIKKIVGSNSSANQSFLVKNLEVQAPVSGKPSSTSTVNLVSLFGLQIFLPVTIVSGVTYTSSLIIYSGGINQNYDCTVDYSVFVETLVTT
jgi:hypothetical protein